MNDADYNLVSDGEGSDAEDVVPAAAASTGPAEEGGSGGEEGGTAAVEGGCGDEEGSEGPPFEVDDSEGVVGDVPQELCITYGVIANAAAVTVLEAPVPSSTPAADAGVRQSAIPAHATKVSKILISRKIARCELRAWGWGLVLVVGNGIFWGTPTLNISNSTRSNSHKW